MPLYFLIGNVLPGRRCGLCVVGYYVINVRMLTMMSHDYLLVLSSTCISCQRHRRARVASDTAPGRIIGHIGARGL
eukprot:459952-Prymnesium_polylepis.1